MKLADCNIHLDQFQSPLSILKEYSYFNIEKVVSLCDHFESYEYLSQLFVDHKNVLFGIGLHPNRKYTNDEVKRILYLIKNKANIIGECGLDFIGYSNPPQLQIRNLIYQLNVAEKNNKVLILHIKQAEKEILDILNSYRLKSVIFHWYSGPISYIDEIISKEYFFSFNNCIIHYKKYQNYITRIPLRNLLLESDAPYEFRGIVTKPEDFPIMIKIIAEIKSLEPEFVSDMLYKNFIRIFLKKQYIKKRKNDDNFNTLDNFL